MSVKVRLCGQRNWWGVDWHFLLFLPGDSCLHLHLLQLVGLLHRHLRGSPPRRRHQPFLLLLHIRRHCPCRHHICCTCRPRNQREDRRRDKTTIQIICPSDQTLFHCPFLWYPTCIRSCATKVVEWGIPERNIARIGNAVQWIQVFKQCLKYHKSQGLSLQQNDQKCKNCHKLSRCWSSHVSSSLWSNVSKVTGL